MRQAKFEDACEDVQKVLEAMSDYDGQYPDAIIEAYRFDSDEIRLRVLHNGLRDLSFDDRQQYIDDMLSSLDAAIRRQVKFVLAVTEHDLLYDRRTLNRLFEDRLGLTDASQPVLEDLTNSPE